MSPAEATEVHIESDGTCLIDGEFIPVPPGADVANVVLTHLQLEAAATGGVLHAVIHDRANGADALPLRVRANGSSEPWDSYPDIADPLVPAEAPPVPGWDQLPRIELRRPWTVLPQPDAQTLQTIRQTMIDIVYQEAVRQHRNAPVSAADMAALVLPSAAAQQSLAEQTAAADQLLARLSRRAGPDHWHTLVAGHVRGELGWLTQDLSNTTRLYLYAARAWVRGASTNHVMVRHSMNNALGCWKRLSSQDALDTEPAVLEALTNTARIDPAAAHGHLKRMRENR